MTRIFINYRRGDTSTIASRLYEWLAARYGDDQVFMDVDMIVPGRPWREAIDRAVGSSNLVLAVIGKDWLPELNRRLADEDDFMRHELETALRRDVSIIPVLTEDARMPRSSELPESLAALSDYQAFELLGRFQFDKQELLKSVDRALGLEREVSPSPQPPPQPTVSTPAPTHVSPTDSAAPVERGSRLRRPRVRWQHRRGRQRRPRRRPPRNSGCGCGVPRRPRGPRRRRRLRVHLVVGRRGSGSARRLRAPGDARRRRRRLERCGSSRL